MWAAPPTLLVDLRRLSAQESRGEGVSVMRGEVGLEVQWKREGGGG